MVGKCQCERTAKKNDQTGVFFPKKTLISTRREAAQRELPQVSFQQQLKTIYNGTCGVGILLLSNSLATGAWPCTGTKLLCINSSVLHQDRGCPSLHKGKAAFIGGWVGTLITKIHPRKTTLAVNMLFPLEESPS